MALTGHIRLAALAALAPLHALGTRSVQRLSTQADGGTDHQADFERIIQGLPSPSSSGQSPTAATAADDTTPPDASTSRPSTSHAPVGREAKPHELILDPKYGYAVLGGVEPAGSANSWHEEVPKISVLKEFRPGETYAPKDLNPFHSAEEAVWKPPQTWGAAPHNATVYSMADYKHTDYLQQFVSASGRLLPRKRTKLNQATHKHVMRQIKIARVMALMPHQARLGDDQRRRLRQFELLQSRMRAEAGRGPPVSGAAAGGGLSQE